MGASSIYRHVQSKEELLIEELSEMQEEAWSRFRVNDDRNRATADRLRNFFDAQHELLVAVLDGLGRRGVQIPHLRPIGGSLEARGTQVRKAPKFGPS